MPGRSQLARVAAFSWPFPPLAAGVAVLALLGSLGSSSLDRTVVTMLINLVLVVGLFVFIGNSGVFSFGHMAFMAVGAYTAAILVVPPDRKELLFTEMFGFLQQAHAGPAVATLAGGAAAAAAAALVAVPLMRLSGLTAALASFALLIIVNVVATNWKQVTNATSGISGLPASVGVPEALGWAVAALFVAALFQRTASCFRLKATREDLVAAQAAGIRVGRERWIAFVISAFVTGLGGALFAQSIGSITPSSFYLTITFLIIAMLVVGGMHTLSGAVVGAVVLSAIAEILRRFEQGIDVGGLSVEAPSGLREVGFAVALLAMLLLRQEGLVGRREVPLPRALRAAPAGAEDEAAPPRSPR